MNTEPVRRKTYCRICEASCGLIAEIDKTGRVSSLKPDPDHPLSAGYACAKGTRFATLSNGADTLKFPMKRASSGELVRISWDEAMDLIATRLKPIIDRHGPHALGIYSGNPLLFHTLGLISSVTFRQQIGTRNAFSSSSQDCNNKFVGAQIIHGGELIQPIPDLEHAKLALMFGTNPAVSNGSFVHLEGGATAFDRYQRRGGQVLWIDPHQNESARRWGEHLAIVPGTDIFLLLALLYQLRDLYKTDRRVSGLTNMLNLAEAYPPEVAAPLTGIDSTTIKELSKRIRQSEATTFHMSVGVNMGAFGTLAYVALQALAYLTGNLDARGGLLFHRNGERLSRLLRKWGVGTHPQASRIAGVTGVFDELPGGILADEITTPGEERIRAMIVTAGNPVHSIPGVERLKQAFASLDFLVQIDCFANETTAYADLVLPAPDWLSRWDVALPSSFLQKGPILQVAGPVQTPLSEVRNERTIFADMSLVLERPLFGNRALARLWGHWPLERLLHGFLSSLFWPWRLLHGGVQALPMPRLKVGSYLPGRKEPLRFWHAKLEGEPQRLAAFAQELKQETRTSREGERALTLIGRRRKACHNSWLHGARRHQTKRPVAWMDTQDLLQLGLPKGGPIQIVSATGSVNIDVIGRKEVMAGTIVVPHGLAEANINVLFPSGLDHIDPVSGNHRMTALPVLVNARSSVTPIQRP